MEIALQYFGRASIPSATTTPPFGLACRVYRTEHGYSGGPSLFQLRSVIDTATKE